MSTCSCGNPTDGKSTQCPRCAALRILELAPDATDDQIRNAYRTLVKVWHPDRFPNDPQLKQSAEDKLKDINSAYVFLTSSAGKGSRRQPPSRPANESESQDSSPNAEPTPDEAERVYTAPVAPPDQNPAQWIWPAIKLFSKLAFVAIVLLFARYVWIAFDVPDPTTDAVEKVYGYSKSTVIKGLDGPKRRFLEAIEHDLQRFNLGKSEPEPAANPQPDQASQPGELPERQPASPRPERLPAPSRRAPSATRTIVSYITVGLTRDEVLSNLGPATESSENKLVYGRSEFSFKNNVVVGWRIDPATPIRVKLWPETAVDAGMEYFTVGSSKDVVLSVQGTPSGLSENTFAYGASEVYFRNNRVVNWKSDPSSVHLRAQVQ